MTKMYYSPAKINLFLRVLRKRPDGFHEICTLMQAVSLFDQLHVSFFEGQGNNRLTSNDQTLPLDETNLVIKAAKLFQKHFCTQPFYIKVHLEKNIPQMAGLGGGSSNAATILWALNEHFGMPFSNQELTTMAKEIGSDISFFFSEGIAKCEGRGELLTPVSKSKALTRITLFKPDSQQMSTPTIYQACIPNIYFKDINTEDCLKSFDKNTPMLLNDLEHPVMTLYPEMKAFKDHLEKHLNTPVVLTGSGAAFFSPNNQPTAKLAPWQKLVSVCFRTPSSWYQPN